MENEVYLLRLQRKQGSDHWQATLQNVHTGALLRFANEREMLRYLLKSLAVRFVSTEEPNTSQFSQSEDAS